MAYETVIMLCLFVLILGHYVSRLIFKINSQVWRYGGIQSYINRFAPMPAHF